MKNPLAVERRFAGLQYALPLVSSRRTKLALLLDFFASLPQEGDSAFLHAYSPELLPVLLDTIQRTDFTGTPPAFLDQLVSLLSRLEVLSLGIATRQDLDSCRGHLASQHTRISAWLSDRGTAVPVAGRASVWVPLVETEPLLTDLPPRFAGLHCLTVDVQPGRKAGSEDVIRFAELSSGSDTPAVALKTAIKAARALLAKMASPLANRGLVIDCSLGRPGLVTGDSLEAGLAAVVLTELMRIRNHSEDLSIGPDAALTGRIDFDGTILPVDEEGLRRKVEACYYSWVRYLVVPADQATVCREHVNALLRGEGEGKRESEPRNEKNGLEIVPIGRLEDLFNSRRLVHSRHVPVIVRAGREAWKRRRPLAATGFVALLGVVFLQAVGPIDRSPVIGEYSGEVLALKNAGGQALGEIRVGKQIVDSEAEVELSGRPVPFHGFADVNADGRNEVIVSRENPVDRVGEVACMTELGSKELWSRKLQRHLVFPEKSDVESPNFHCGGVLAGDIDGDRTPEVIVLARHAAFASFILVLDARTGAERGCYLHVGHIRSLVLADLDGDMRPELLAAGVNQSEASGCLAVLDPRGLDGWGPTSGDYEPQGFVLANHRNYMVIPRTRIGDLFWFKEKGSRAVGVAVDLPNSRISLFISDFADVPVDFGNELTGHIEYCFDLDLSPVNVITGDNFDIAAQELAKKGAISRTPGADFWLDQFARIRYWAAGGWQTTSDSQRSSSAARR
jgi:hypothetical protein